MGLANKPVRKGFENSRVFVGKWKSPIAIIKRHEIAGYITEDFLCYYECWKIFNAGLGLPMGEGWGQYPHIFVSIITTLESDYKILTSK